MACYTIYLDLHHEDDNNDDKEVYILGEFLVKNESYSTLVIFYDKKKVHSLIDFLCYANELCEYIESKKIGEYPGYYMREKLNMISKKVNITHVHERIFIRPMDFWSMKEKEEEDKELLKFNNDKNSSSFTWKSTFLNTGRDPFEIVEETAFIGKDFMAQVLLPVILDNQILNNPGGTIRYIIYLDNITWDCHKKNTDVIHFSSHNHIKIGDSVTTAVTIFFNKKNLDNLGDILGLFSIMQYLVDKKMLSNHLGDYVRKQCDFFSKKGVNITHVEENLILPEGYLNYNSIEDISDKQKQCEQKELTSFTWRSNFWSNEIIKFKLVEEAIFAEDFFFDFVVIPFINEEKKNDIYFRHILNKKLSFINSINE